MLLVVFFYSLTMSECYRFDFSESLATLEHCRFIFMGAADRCSARPPAAAPLTPASVSDKLINLTIKIWYMCVVAVRYWLGLRSLVVFPRETRALGAICRLKLAGDPALPFDSTVKCDRCCRRAHFPSSAVHARLSRIFRILAAGRFRCRGK
ncbi:hypothetical protein Taro_018466 [Colocasia esculenta]|uniref:Uncharacterized protein n=1 Tax=Colocasia esculenta TaxID=4460 RepID=A0A843UWE1_COLES|nr:hypothetical protein [Colocasia esculenta]